MTRAELVSALREAAFDYLSDAEAAELVATAIADTVTLEPWPFRQTILDAAAGSLIDVTELGPISAVTLLSGTSEVRELQHAGSVTEVREERTVSQTGEPTYFYLEGETTGSEPRWTLRVHPDASATLRIRHLRPLPWLGDPTFLGSDLSVPALPEVLQHAALHRARQLAYEETDESALAEKMERRWELALQRARHMYFQDLDLGRKYIRASGDMV